MDDYIFDLQHKAVWIIIAIERELGISPWPPRIGNVKPKSKPCVTPFFSGDLSKFIGGRIHTFRRMRGITQEKLAQLVHLDPGQVSRHERGFGLTIDVLPLYADALGYDLKLFMPPGKSELIYDGLEGRISQIVERFLTVYDLPAGQREDVIRIVECTLNLALPISKGDKK